MEAPYRRLADLNTLPPPVAAAWRRENLGHLLFASRDQCARRKLAIVHQAGFPMVTDAQLALFQSLDDEGARLTTVAARAGITKQSMIELVDKAQASDLIDRSDDPADGRAKIVRPTASGRRLQRALRNGMDRAEQEFCSATGKALCVRIKAALGGYVGNPAEREVAITPGGVEQLLGDAAEQFVRNVINAVHRRGYRDVSEVLLALFRNLDLEGSRLTEVAVLARMTKQSMRELVGRAETLGYVQRLPDGTDGRAKTIRFSPAGLRMLDEMRVGVSAAEAQFASGAGQTFLLELKSGLTAYLASNPPT